MTKIRITLLLLILALLLPLASCGNKIIEPNNLLTVRKGEESATRYFASKSGNTALEVRLPKDWEIKKGDDGYQLLNGDNVVGTVILTDTDKAPEGFDTEITPKKAENIAVTVHIGKHKGGGKTLYYRITHSYTEGKTKRTVAFEIKQEEMDKTLYGWLTKPTLTAVRESLSVPSLSLSGGNSKKSVLIVGNSFVGTSSIGHILNDLVKSGNKECSVASKSIGYATITKYATSSDNSDFATFRNRMENGTYGIVFLCGLYSADDVANIATVEALCKKSNTQLVLLPAHNENATHIAAAAEKYPHLPILNWKSMVNAYNRAGVDTSDLCIDDAHNHSTPLAGYIGAAMIYEALFGENAPSMPANCSVLSANEVEAKLGDHTPRAQVYIAEKDLHRLS